MATWDDVKDIAMSLPEVEERTSADGVSQWRVRNKLFVWERPLRPADLKALGHKTQDRPVFAAWLPDLGAKEALLADDPEVYFTTAHFHGYAIILVWLDTIPKPELRELTVEAWLTRAPARLAKRYSSENALE